MDDCLIWKELFTSIGYILRRSITEQNFTYRLQEYELINDFLNTIESDKTAPEVAAEATASHRAKGFWVAPLHETVAAEIGSLELFLDEAIARCKDHQPIDALELSDIADTADWIGHIGLLHCERKL